MTPRDRVRELAEELYVLSRQRPGTPYGREQMEAALRAFLAEWEAPAVAAVVGEALVLHQEVAAQRDRALAEGAGLREALERLMHRLDEHFGGPDRSYDWQEQRDARSALASSPLSKLAGEVLEMAIAWRSQGCQREEGDALAGLVDALRAELDREGGEGG